MAALGVALVCVGAVCACFFAGRACLDARGRHRRAALGRLREQHGARHAYEFGRERRWREAFELRPLLRWDVGRPGRSRDQRDDFYSARSPEGDAAYHEALWGSCRGGDEMMAREEPET